ncbi:hypothetical protein Tco_0887594 [Tanacetum coccineum]
MDLDKAFVPIDDQVKIGACNMRIAPEKKQKEPTYQLTLDILKKYSCYNAFLKTRYSSIYTSMLYITPKVPNPEFVEPPPHNILYLLSNNLVTQKEKIKDVVKKKDIVPRKKRSITVADNIFPNPEEAVKLAEIISLTEAEHQDEERHLHETHASLVIGREAKEVANTVASDKTEDEEEDRLIRRRQTGVVIGRDVYNISNEEKFDHSHKLKGIETLSDAAKLLSDIKTTTRASKQDYRIQQYPKGLSKGTRVIPEIPNEPRDIFDKSDRGSDDEKVEILSSDYERT